MLSSSPSEEHYATADVFQHGFAVPKPAVCVIIPTFRRPEGLKRVIASVQAQNGTGGYAVSILVCDNSPEASARATFDALPVRSDMPQRYIHEPNTGLANARNAAVTAAADADFIAFVDDDEEAKPDWLAQLLTAQKTFNADAVFGPVEARLPPTLKRYHSYFQTFFSRIGPDSSQVFNQYYGCGNSLVRVSALPSTAPFSTFQNEMGGEDDMLFSGMLLSGAVMAWSAEAHVYEDVPAARARLRYTLRRGFAYGQGPSHAEGLNGRWLQCAYWMVNGLAQAAVFTAPALVMRAFNHPKAAYLLDKAARGWGKFLWYPPFKLKFYGQAMLKKKAA